MHPGLLQASTMKRFIKIVSKVNLKSQIILTKKSTLGPGLVP